MNVSGLRAADETVGGIVHFGRMLDKIRLQSGGQLAEGYFLGDEDPTWWDGRCCRFLGVNYAELASQVCQGLTDEAAIEWCFAHGRRPTPEEVQIWDAFILKRGWNDESTAGLQAEKDAAGWGRREDIVTWVDLFKAQES